MIWSHLVLHLLAPDNQRGWETGREKGGKEKKDWGLERWEVQQWWSPLKSFNGKVCGKWFSPFLCSPDPSVQRAGSDCDCCQLDPLQVLFFRLGQANSRSGKTCPGCWICTFAFFLKPKLYFYLVWVIIQKKKKAQIFCGEKQQKTFLAQTYASHISTTFFFHVSLTSEGHKLNWTCRFGNMQWYCQPGSHRAVIQHGRSSSTPAFRKRVRLPCQSPH